MLRQALRQEGQRDLLSVPKLVKLTLEDLKKKRPGTSILFAVCPSHRFIGKRLPQIILGFPRVFESTDDEEYIEIWLSHELRHIKDCYFGIKINDYWITQETLDQQLISGKFFNALIELRGSYHTFYRVFKKGSRRTKKIPFNEGEGFAKSYLRIRKIASTEVEKLITEIQLRECRVIPKKLKLTRKQRKMGIKKGFTFKIGIGKKPMYLTLLTGGKKAL